MSTGRTWTVGVTGATGYARGEVCRVLAGIGTTDAAFDSDRVDVTINGVTVCRGGFIGDPREGVDLTGRAITGDVDLAAGAEQATIWTNDRSIAYVHENSAYST